MKMSIITKIHYKIIYLLYTIKELFLHDSDTARAYNSFAAKYITFNNNRVLKLLAKKKLTQNERVLLLLPHCLQYHDCPFRITTDVENCHKCGRCVIDPIVRLKEKYPVDIQVATGGTLARKHIKTLRPSVVLAVACKRDLMLGINDALPMRVYGVFNDIPGEPCIDTTVSMDKINYFLERVYG